MNHIILPVFVVPKKRNQTDPVRHAAFMFPVSRTTPSSYDHSYDGVRYGPKEHMSGGWGRSSKSGRMGGCRFYGWNGHWRHE